MPVYDILKFIEVKEQYKAEHKALQRRVEEVVQVIVECAGVHLDTILVHEGYEYDDYGPQFQDEVCETIALSFEDTTTLRKIPDILKNDRRFDEFPVSYLTMTDQEIKDATFEKYGEKLVKCLAKRNEDKDKKERKKAILEQLAPEDRSLFE